MRNLRSFVLSGFLFLYMLAPLFMATAPADFSYKGLYEKQLLENEMLIREVQNKEAQLCDLQVAPPTKPVRSRKTRVKSEGRAPLGLLRLEGDYIGNFKWLYEKDHFYIDPTLAIVLSKYTGPNVNITSLHRPHSRGSEHCKGKAVDVKFDSAGKQLAAWLISDDGKKWIEDNNITIYFEKIYDKKYTTGEFKSFYLYNLKATGPHIHIEI